MSHHILVVEDDQDMRAELERVLKKRGFQVTLCESAESALVAVASTPFDAVVTDINMRGTSGIELCDRIVRNHRNLPVIIVTGFGTMETAIATMRAGAFDFLTKPFNAEQLVLVVGRAIEHFQLREEVKRLRREVSEAHPFEDIVGRSAPMKNMLEILERVAETEATLLITGESGTGKELVARALHARSRRKEGPMIAINCAAIPEALLESELFGHMKGAFTDAKASKRGLFQEASGGTLFLDEIGEMPMAMQAKLLRALEQRSVRPVGSNAEVAFDARLVVATNRDLETLVHEHKFREDLYYRVNVVHVEVPPLRSRGHDILLLAQTFIERMSKRHGKKVIGMSPEVGKKLLAYAWPGNVRELLNSMERAVALARLEELSHEDLPPKIQDYVSTRFVLEGTDPTEMLTLDEIEKRYIQRVMEAVSWNKTEATKILGIDRSTLYRKLERYGLSTAGA